MPRTKTKADVAEFIRRAAKWPTIADICEQYDLPERYVRSVVERRAVTCIRLDFMPLGLVGALAYALVLATVPFIDTFDALFPVSGLLAVWAVIAGIMLLVRRG